jgi:serine/threonine-protein kinase
MTHDPRDVELGRRAIERGVLDREQARAILERATAERCGFVEAARRAGALDAAREQALLALVTASVRVASVPTASAATVASPAQPASAAPPSATPQVGASLGGYVLERVLGQGGMGAVFAGRNDAGMVRAIKVPLFSGDGAADARARFEREARALAKIPPHANVVRVHACATEGTTTWCVLELVEGESLEKTIARGALPIERALELAEAIARALAHVHALGIVHRDVKPANVIVRPDGTPVLMDFGLARDVEERERLTQTGTMLGTPAYMAPEQHDGARDVDGRADVWAVGVLLHEAIAGERPFVGAPFEIVKKVLVDDPRPLGALRPGVPRDVETIVLRALAKDRERRYPSAQTLADDLARARRGEHVLARRPGLGERLGRHARRVPARGIVAGAFVAVAGLGATFLVIRRLQAREEAARWETGAGADLDAAAKARAAFRLERVWLSRTAATEEKKLADATGSLSRDLESLAATPGRHDETRARLTEALELSRALAALGTASSREAEPSLSPLVERSPEARLIAASIAVTSSRDKALEEGAALLEPLAKGPEGDAAGDEANAALAWIDRRRDRAKAAVQRLGSRSSTYPAAARILALAHSDLALAHARAGRGDDAAKELAQAVKIPEVYDQTAGPVVEAALSVALDPDARRSATGRRCLADLAKAFLDERPAPFTDRRLQPTWRDLVVRAVSERDAPLLRIAEKATPHLDPALVVPDTTRGQLYAAAIEATAQGRIDDWRTYSVWALKVGWPPHDRLGPLREVLVKKLGAPDAGQPEACYLAAMLGAMGRHLWETPEAAKADRMRELQEALARARRALEVGLHPHVVPYGHELAAKIMVEMGEPLASAEELVHAYETFHPEPVRVCITMAERFVSGGDKKASIRWATEAVRWADDIADRVSRGAVQDPKILCERRPAGFPLRIDDFGSPITAKITAREKLIGFHLMADQDAGADAVLADLLAVDRGGIRSRARQAWVLLCHGKYAEGKAILDALVHEVEAKQDFAEQRDLLHAELVDILAFLDSSGRREAGKIVVDTLRGLR